MAASRKWSLSTSVWHRGCSIAGRSPCRMLKIVKIGQRVLLDKPSANRPAPIAILCPWLRLDHPQGGLNQAWANPRAAPSAKLEAAIEELLYQPLDLAGADWAAPDPASTATWKKHGHLEEAC